MRIFRPYEEDEEDENRALLHSQKRYEDSSTIFTLLTETIGTN